ncbi:MAG: 4-hydroxy-tetrahydrodipicolinate synthase, partial [Pseudonocardia sp.]|nr:4-hydroxy-tetrahydrodipicolinate synthase [Pseudonocardia sp.]
MIDPVVTGSLVALVTPMHADGRIDHAALDRLVERQVLAGTAAIVSVGTTGESATLSVAEHTDVIRRTIDAVAGRVPVIAGTGANSTTEAIHLTKAAAAAGADGALLVTPYYNKPPQEGLFQHFKAVAAAVDIPQILYNVPGRTACDMLPSTVER